MKLLKILLLLSIFLKFYENKEIKIIRKLEEDGTSNINTEEPDTGEVSDSYEYPSHSATSDSAEVHSSSSTTPSSSENPNPTQPSGSGGPSESGSTSEISIDLSNQPSNGTLTEVPTQQTKSYLILVGFGGFTMTENILPPQTDQQGNQVVRELTVVFFSFSIFFKKIYFKSSLSIYMHFHLDVYTSYFLRNLEETQANCTKINEDDENAEYNCTSGIDVSPNQTISGIASKNDYVFNNGTHDEPIGEDNNYEFYQSSYANSTGNNIEQQKTRELSNTILINNARLNIPDPNKPYFEIVGNADKTIDGNEVTFSFDEKGDGKLKNVTCAVVPLNGNNRYQFNCETEKSLRVNINNAMGKASSGNNVLLNFDKDEEGNFNDLLVVNNLNNFYGKQYGSSTGLSGGAIAGIVIACVCALIMIGLLAFCCRGKGNPPPMQETAMQIYSSNSNPDNI